MCHLCSIHYKSSFVAQGIGKWRCVSKNNSNLTFCEVDGTASLQFSVWILGLLFEDHTDKHLKKLMTLHGVLYDASYCFGLRKRNVTSLKALNMPVEHSLSV